MSHEALPDEKLRGLAEREAVPVGDGIATDKRLKARIRQTTLDAQAAQRIGPVADDHRDAVAHRAIQGSAQCREVGVRAAANILKIEHEDVQPFEHRRRWSGRGSVKRINRDPGTRIRVGGDVAASWDIAAHSVFWSEKRHKRHAGRAAQRVDGRRLSVGSDSGRIGHQPDAKTVQRGKSLRGQHFDPGTGQRFSSINTGVFEPRAGALGVVSVGATVFGANSGKHHCRQRVTACGGVGSVYCDGVSTSI